MPGMVMYRYFTATTDNAAAALIDEPGAPGGPTVPSGDLAAALRSGDRDAIRRASRAAVRTTRSGTLVLDVKGIDPGVQLATLEELITGTPYDQIIDGARSACTLATRDNDQRLILTLTDQLQTALTGATPEDLHSVVGPWSRTDEFPESADTESLESFLTALADLAQRATDQQHHLYCWISL